MSTRASEILKLHDSAKELYDTAQKALDNIPADADEGQVREAHGKFDEAMKTADANMDKALKLKELDERQSKLEGIANLSDPQLDDRANNQLPEGDVAKDPGADRYKRAFYEFLACRSAEDIAMMDKDSLAMIQHSQRTLGEQEARSLEKRTQLVATSNLGGLLIPTSVATQIGKRMQYVGPMFEPGITTEITTDDGNPMQFPRVHADELSKVSPTNADPRLNTDMGEIAAVAEDTTTFDNITLSAFTVDSGEIKLSWKLLEDAPQRMGLMDNVIADLLGERIGRTGNKLLTVGTGGTTEPNGIVTGATNGVTGVNKTNGPTVDQVKDLIHSVDRAYRIAGAMRFMFNDSMELFLRKIKEGGTSTNAANVPLWDAADIRSGVPATLLGHPYSVNNDMDSLAGSKNIMVFGDFTKFWVRRVKGMRFVVLRELHALTMETGLFAYVRFDSEVYDDRAIKKMVTAA